MPSPYPIAIGQMSNEDIQRAVRCRSNKEFVETDGAAEFKLHVVEFDDQGLFWNRAQVQDALADIREAKGRSENVLVVAFFHGWFNNTDVCNDNLASASYCRSSPRLNSHRAGKNSRWRCTARRGCREG